MAARVKFNMTVTTISEKNIVKQTYSNIYDNYIFPVVLTC